MSTFINIHNIQVPVTGEPGVSIQDAINSPNFINWYSTLDEELDVRNVHIQSVDIFGSGRVGFIKFKSTVYRKDIPNSRTIPGIVFMRGPSVGILIILHCGEEQYTILTRQARVPTGRSNFPEIPAGTFDGECFSGVASNELKEEVGLVIQEKDLVDMTALAYKNTSPGVYSTPGGNDEYLRLFLYEKEVSPEELRDYQGRCTGVETSGEYITVQVVKLNEVWRLSPDAKTLSSLLLYNELKNNHEL
ncbi:hypothetical protein WA158_000445 [Blastocystis sp. Blastoise]